MRRYLTQVSLSEAVSRIISSNTSLEDILILPVIEALGRIIAKPVSSPETVPSVRLAGRDGYVVQSIDTHGARDNVPLELFRYLQVNTGDIIPDEYDAVIPQEEVYTTQSSGLFIRKPAVKGQFIRRPGDDIEIGRLVLPAGHRIRPIDIGALLTYGIREVWVRELKVGVLPIGDELVPYMTAPVPGEVRASNAHMIATYLQESGVTPVVHQIVPDDPDLIKEGIEELVQNCGILLLLAGSFGGSRDLVHDLIVKIGEVIFHGVAMKPGKSVLYGKVYGKPVFGLPGYPVAAAAAYRVCVLPLLEDSGFMAPKNPIIQATVGESIPGDGGIDEFIPVSIFFQDGVYKALPMSRKEGGQMGFVKADGILHKPASKEGFNEGSVVSVNVMKEIARIKRQVIFSGPVGVLSDRLITAGYLCGIDIAIRPATEISAAVSFVKNNCHGVIIHGGKGDHKSEALKMIRYEEGSFLCIPLGPELKERDDLEEVVLIFRRGSLSNKLMDKLIGYISSDSWREIVS